jgi:hypothetical protein
VGAGGNVRAALPFTVDLNVVSAIDIIDDPALLAERDITLD